MPSPLTDWRPFLSMKSHEKCVPTVENPCVVVEDCVVVVVDDVVVKGVVVTGVVLTMIALGYEPLVKGDLPYKAV